jgi:hypothetical protein
MKVKNTKHNLDIESMYGVTSEIDVKWTNQ